MSYKLEYVEPKTKHHWSFGPLLNFSLNGKAKIQKQQQPSLLDVDVKPESLESFRKASAWLLPTMEVLYGACSLLEREERNSLQIGPRPIFRFPIFHGGV